MLGKETSLYSLEIQNKQTKGLFLLFAVKITSRVDHPDLWWHILFHFVEFVIILKEKHFNYLGRIQSRTLKNVIHTRSWSDIISVIWLTFSIVGMSHWHTHTNVLQSWYEFFKFQPRNYFPLYFLCHRNFLDVPEEVIISYVFLVRKAVNVRNDFPFPCLSLTKGYSQLSDKQIKE